MAPQTGQPISTMGQFIKVPTPLGPWPYFVNVKIYTHWDIEKIISMVPWKKNKWRVWEWQSMSSAPRPIDKNSTRYRDKTFHFRDFLTEEEAKNYLMLRKLEE